MTLTYAGIGARATPPTVLERMTVMAAWLARRGWHLHTGGADGADNAFALGAPQAQRTSFLPWPGYNGRKGGDCRSLSPRQLDTLIPIAADAHPAWRRCSPAVRKLHARNAAILLGPDADAPVRAVVCWTEGGRVQGEPKWPSASHAGTASRRSTWRSSNPRRLRTPGGPPNRLRPIPGAVPAARP